MMSVSHFVRHRSPLGCCEVGRCGSSAFNISACHVSAQDESPEHKSGIHFSTNGKEACPCEICPALLVNDNITDQHYNALTEFVCFIAVEHDYK